MAGLLPNSLTPDWESTTDSEVPFLFNANTAEVLKETGQILFTRVSSVQTAVLSDDQKYLRAGCIVAKCTAITSLSTDKYMPAKTISSGATATDYKIILSTVTENRPFVALINKAKVNDAVVRTASGYTAGATAYTTVKANVNTITANETPNLISFE